MDPLWLRLCIDTLPVMAQGVMHLLFVGKLSGKRPALRHFAAYLFLTALIKAVFDALALIKLLSWTLTRPLLELSAVGAELFALYGMSRSALRNRPFVSWTAAVLTVYIAQLSFGMVDPLEAMILPAFMGQPLFYPMLLLATLLAFVLCACCYRLVLKTLSLKEEAHTPCIWLLLFSGLFFFAAELYLLQTSYSVLPDALSPEGAGKHILLLFLQLLGLGALFCMLYAYQQICRGVQAQAALASLTQAAKAQKTYIAEAQTRYAQTKAFRHDIQNHLAVSKGLLDAGRWDEAKAYLQKLASAAASLSFPYQTGDPVVDILLHEKLGPAKAKGIDVEVSLLLPKPCQIDAFDLCVLFANALDNAIAACQSVESAGPKTAAHMAAGCETGGVPAKDTRSIRVTGEQQGDLFRLAFENTCLPGPLPPMGTGLSNIKAVAEKYHGAMLTEKVGSCFRLDVLLDISLRSDCISA